MVEEIRQTTVGGVAAVAATALALALALAGCGDDRADGREASSRADPGPTTPDRSVVVVSVPPLAWFVDRLAGDRVEVSVMVPPGASPATYEPTARQMRVVARADLYVSVGHPRFPFDATWLGALTDSNPGMSVVRAGEDCRATSGDPHLWLSTACARKIAGTVGRALERAPGGPPPDLEERRRALAATVDSVEAEMARRLGPHRGEAFLVFHPALGYLAREFGLRQMAIARGPAGPGAAELGAIVRDARQAGIHTVFVQPQFSKEAARVVAGALPDGRVERVDPLARDWASGMVEIADRISASFAPRRSEAVPRPPASAGPSPR